MYALTTLELGLIRLTIRRWFRSWHEGNWQASIKTYDDWMKSVTPIGLLLKFSAVYVAQFKPRTDWIKLLLQWERFRV